MKILKRGVIWKTLYDANGNSIGTIMILIYCKITFPAQQDC